MKHQSLINPAGISTLAKTVHSTLRSVIFQPYSFFLFLKIETFFFSLASLCHVCLPSWMRWKVFGFSFCEDELSSLSAFPYDHFLFSRPSLFMMSTVLIYISVLSVDSPDRKIIPFFTFGCLNFSEVNVKTIFPLVMSHRVLMPHCFLSLV